MKLLHNTIKTGLKNDQIHLNGAKQSINGWMHIHDQRSVPVWGPIGDPEDIIASVLVQDSNIIPDTYQPVPSYRLFTQDGMMQLTPSLRNKLHEALLRVAELEKSISIQSESVRLESANQVGPSATASPV
ncbi:hypothetical protein BDQ17DRAFT_1345063 [Cyathus striatus]|nr:hypothetical protein BDQ17DRAFT_1345063 [Cyathus striatus]